MHGGAGRPSAGPDLRRPDHTGGDPSRNLWEARPRRPARRRPHAPLRSRHLQTGPHPWQRTDAQGGADVACGRATVSGRRCPTHSADGDLPANLRNALEGHDSARRLGVCAIATMIRAMFLDKTLPKHAAPTAVLGMLALACSTPPVASRIQWGDKLLRQSPEWYGSNEAREAGDSVIEHQSPHGGWPKNTDLLALPSSPDARGRPTIDKGATTTPMRFLALVAARTDEARFRQAFLRGLDYLLAAQYPSGGWPQYFPLREGYYSRITYNDNAMVNVLEVLSAASKCLGQNPRVAKNSSIVPLHLYDNSGIFSVNSCLVVTTQLPGCTQAFVARPRLQGAGRLA